MGLTNQRKTPIDCICAYCGKSFKVETYQVRRCCNRSCSVRLGMMGRGDCAPWDKPEGQTELLESIAGTVPRQDLEKTYNKKAKRLGFPQRNETSLVIQLKRMGLSQQATEDNWKASTLAQMLGIHRDRVRVWMHGSKRDGVRSGGVLPYRKISNITAISKKDFIEFARNHPEKLQGIHPRNLIFVLGNESLVHKIISMGAPSTGFAHELIRVDTGERFKSARDAAKKLHMAPKHLLRQTKRGKKAYGVEFRVVKVEGANDYSHLASQFSPREIIEKQIEELRLEGYSSRAIAGKLGVSRHTVRNYIHKKTDIRIGSGNYRKA